MPEIRLVGNWLAIRGYVWLFYLIFLILAKRWRRISCPLRFFFVVPRLSRRRIFPIAYGLYAIDRTGDELAIRAAAVLSTIGSVDLAVTFFFSFFYFIYMTTRRW